MKAFRCDCGQRVFFENTACFNCGHSLGFDPGSLSMESSADGIVTTGDGRRFRYCRNWSEYGNCNWLVPGDSAEGLCLSCAANRVIPDLTTTRNRELWTTVEEAKRRLYYSLLRYGLPLAGNGNPLRFRIMEDQRRNPDVLESFIATGHLDGTITINIAEADDVAREAIREQLQERYRTVLGHLRHEAGHFYFGVLVTGDEIDTCRELFGDERLDYATTLERYYLNGPRNDWHLQFVSAYASAHPAEDFAETFAHLLHIDDALETARESGLLQREPGLDTDWKDTWLDHWIRLAISLNEMMRSLGGDDPYPFVLTGAIRRKLEFVNRLVNRPTEQRGG